MHVRAVFPNGDDIITCAEGRAVNTSSTIIWNTDGEQKRVLKGHTSYVYAVTVLPNGHRSEIARQSAHVHDCFSARAASSRFSRSLSPRGRCSTLRYRGCTAGRLITSGRLSLCSGGPCQRAREMGMPAQRQSDCGGWIAISWQSVRKLTHLRASKSVPNRT